MYEALPGLLCPLQGFCLVLSSYGYFIFFYVSNQLNHIVVCKMFWFLFEWVFTMQDSQ